MIKSKLIKWLRPTRLLVKRGRVLLVRLKDYVDFLWHSSAVVSLIIPKEGYLPWGAVFKLSYRNLRHSFSRSAVTIGAIAAGSATIVFLVGFGYGLQQIVTDRLITPNALRLADVQSGSTALVLDKAALKKIEQIDGVASVAPAMSMVASIKLNDSRTEAIVMGVRNKFLDFTFVKLLAGTQFSDEAEAVYDGRANGVSDLIKLMDQGADLNQSSAEGKVAGVSTEFVPQIGEIIDKKPVSFRVADGVYVPLRISPRQDAKVLGFVRGSVIETLQAQEVWGGEYMSVGTAGRAYVTSNGDWYGRWLKLNQPTLVFDQPAPTVFVPKVDKTGKQVSLNGFLTQDRVNILTPQVTKADQILEQLSKEAEQSQGQVLGDATAGGELVSETASKSANKSASYEVAVVLDASSSATAQKETQVLKSIVASEQLSAMASISAQSARIGLPRPGGKEILVSTALLKIWNQQPADVIGQTATVEYVMGGGLIPGVKGRVVTDATKYTIVGVFDNDKQSMIYAPLTDFESMGVDKYTIAKVLANSEEALPLVREQIEAQGFYTRSLADTLSQVERLFRVMRFLLGSLGLIAFIVALFGMFNTLTISLLERTREIGVMKTFGTVELDVTRLLIVESSLMGVVGGILGSLFGVLSGMGLNLIVSLFKGGAAVNMFKFPLGFLLFVFLLATFVGLLTGLYPAHRARKITALDALRYE